MTSKRRSKAGDLRLKTEKIFRNRIFMVEHFHLSKYILEKQKLNMDTYR